MIFWWAMARTAYWRGKGRLAIFVLGQQKRALAYTPSGGRKWLEAADGGSMLLLPYLIGKYEAAVRKVIAGEYRQLRERGLWFVDVGANVGYYSVDAMAAGVQVLAIEPNSDAYHRMFENFQMTRGTVLPFIAAASNSRGKVELHCDPGMVTGASLAKMGGRTQARDVYTFTIDDMVGNRAVGLIKLDIEGGELAALEGAGGTLRDSHPTVVYEENDGFCRAFGNPPGAAQRFLEGLGYEVGVIDVDRHTGTRNLLGRWSR